MEVVRRVVLGDREPDGREKNSLRGAGYKSGEQKDLSKNGHSGDTVSWGTHAREVFPSA